MAHLFNSGHAVVTQDPNLEATLQANPRMRLAVLDDGSSVWKYVDSNPAGTKWVVLTSERYDLSNAEVELDYTYFGDIVYGILLQIPAPVSGTNYIFSHNLNIDKYLTLEVVNDGIPKVPNPFISNAGREDLLQLVNSNSGSLALGSSSINVDGVDFSGFNSFIYIEYTKSTATEGIGLDAVGTSAIGVG